MKTFNIELNDQIIPDKNKCLFMDMLTPELAPLRREGFHCMTYVHWLGKWMVERNGQSQKKHIDFFWIFGDGFRVECEAGTFEPVPGELLIVPSWFDRRLSINSPDCPHVYVRSDMVEKFPQFQEIILRKSSLDSEFQSDVIRLARLCSSYHSDKMLLTPLAELIAAQFRKEVAHSDDDAEFFRRELFAVLNSESGLSVSMLAEKLCISESGLHKKCRQIIGCSPGQLLMEHRLQNARQNLLCASYPIREIAKMAGYSDEIAFAKAFRKFFGVSPAACRKKSPRTLS